MHKTLSQTLLAAFCAILCATPLEGGGVMLIGMRNAMLAGGGSQPSGGYWGLCFMAEEAGAVVAMSGRGTLASSVNLLYSTDPSNASSWTPFAIGTDTITLANVGDKVWFKAGPGGNTQFYASPTNNVKFVINSGLIAASGSVQSLINGEEETYSIPANSCFRTLFTTCRALTSAPDLPATSLMPTCYQMMFYQCTSLTSAPTLPAIALEQQCYSGMFNGCTSLTTAPYLPATTLTTGCYVNMFQNCSSLTTIRTAQTDAWGTTGTTSDPTFNWVKGVAFSGTFYCDARLSHTLNDYSNSRIPLGWTVVAS